MSYYDIPFSPRRKSANIFSNGESNPHTSGKTTETEHLELFKLKGFEVEIPKDAMHDAKGAHGSIYFFKQDDTELAIKTGEKTHTEIVISEKLNSPYFNKMHQNGKKSNEAIMLKARGSLNLFTVKFKNFFKNPDRCEEDKIAVFLYFCSQIISGLKDMHTQIKGTHNDIKPDNILISQDNIFLIADFGSVLFETPKEFNNVTPSYTAPETYAPEWKSMLGIEGEIYTGRSDLWGFGATLFEFIFGEKYYSRVDPKSMGMAVGCFGFSIEIMAETLLDHEEEFPKFLEKKLEGFPDRFGQIVYDVLGSTLQLKQSERIGLSDLMDLLNDEWQKLCQEDNPLDIVKYTKELIGEIVASSS